MNVDKNCKRDYTYNKGEIKKFMERLERRIKSLERSVLSILIACGLIVTLICFK